MGMRISDEDGGGERVLVLKVRRWSLEMTEIRFMSCVFGGRLVG